MSEPGTIVAMIQATKADRGMILKAWATEYMAGRRAAEVQAKAMGDALMEHADLAEA